MERTGDSILSLQGTLVSVNLKVIANSREFYLIVLAAVLLVVASSVSEYFFTVANFDSILLSISVYGIIAAALSILFISGGFDLSVGSVMTTLGVILGMSLMNGVSTLFSILITLAVGAGVGLSIGLLVSKVKVNPFITTLAYYFIFRGLSWIIGFGSKVRKGVSSPYFTDFPEAFTSIAGGRFFGIQKIFVYAIAIVIIFQLLQSKNVFFRQNMYLGGNEEAARVVGIRINLLRIFNYTLVSTMAGLSAVLRASAVGGTTAGLAGPTFALIAIAAVIIGGASLRGGSGSVVGSFLGVIILTLLYNIMNLIGIDPFYNELTIGSILLISVFFDEFLKKRLVEMRENRIKSRP